MKLNPQAAYIYNILRDHQWHCCSEWGYADGHCKRITDINRFLLPQGLEVVGGWCICGKHTSKVKMRRIMPIGSTNEIANKFLSDFAKDPDIELDSNQLSMDF